MAAELAGAPAQQFPSKPVRIIVPFLAAGAVDATTLSINLYKDLPCDPAKFVPITITATLPNAIAARWGNRGLSLRFLTL